MNPETSKDELRMSWNKKVSLREIAQFYEDKLRELDAKQTVMMEEISKKEANIETRMKIIENSLENAKDFVEKLDEAKEYIEEVKNALTSPYDSINSHLRGLNKLYGILQDNIIGIKQMLRIIALNQIAEHVAFEAFETFMIGLFASDGIFSNKMRSLIDHVDVTFLTEALKPLIEEDLKKYLGNVTMNDSQIEDFAHDAVTAVIHKVSDQLKFVDNAEKLVNVITSKEVQR